MISYKNYILIEIKYPNRIFIIFKSLYVIVYIIFIINYYKLKCKMIL